MTTEQQLEKIDQQPKDYASDNFGMRKTSIGRTREVNTKRDDYCVYQFNKSRKTPKQQMVEAKMAKATELDDEIDREIEAVNKSVMEEQ